MIIDEKSGLLRLKSLVLHKTRTQCGVFTVENIKIKLEQNVNILTGSD
jgi:hypothetical protein